MPEAGEVLDLIVDVTKFLQYLIQAMPSITKLLDLTRFELWWPVKPHLLAHLKRDVGVLVNLLGCVLLMVVLDVLGSQLIAYLCLL